MARKDRTDDLYWAQEVEPEVVCPICDRLIEPGDGDDHHLIPRQKGGKNGPLVHIHRFCHDKIHATFSNYDLAKIYNTPEAIRSHPSMADFIRWVANKPSAFYLKTDCHKGRKNSRRDAR